MFLLLKAILEFGMSDFEVGVFSYDRKSQNLTLTRDIHGKKSSIAKNMPKFSDKSDSTGYAFLPCLQSDKLLNSCNKSENINFILNANSMQD